MKDPCEAPIGVFDSGVGGLTVVRALRQAAPAEHVVYLGDTARVPYGSKSPRTVERYSVACKRFLLSHDVKLVLVACNTASATAMPALEAASPVPVIGAVIPGAQSAVAATRNRRIGVIGTLSTVKSGAYERAIEALDGRARVTTHACPLLVPLAEEGWTDDPVAEAIARRYLAELLEGDPDIDTLVLGCTHYPLLATLLGRVAGELAGRPVAVVDSASAMAAAATSLLDGRALRRAGANRGSLHCHVTDASRLDELGPRFLGEALPHVDLADL